MIIRENLDHSELVTIKNIDYDFKFYIGYNGIYLERYLLTKLKIIGMDNMELL